MSNFADFVAVALKMGNGRGIVAQRQMPVFVLEGNYQNELYEKAIEYLMTCGFKILDLRNKTYEDALGSIDLKWPVLLEKWPSGEYEITIKDSEKKLLIACGKESHPRFWKFLSEESLLYCGSELPPLKGISSRCIVVPDSTSVVAIMRQSDYDKFPIHYFGPIGRFNSNTVPFAL
jgi:hypothetical protein